MKNCRCCDIKEVSYININSFECFNEQAMTISKSTESINDYSDDSTIDIIKIDLDEVFEIVRSDCFSEYKELLPLIPIKLTKSKNTTASYRCSYTSKSFKIIEEYFTFNTLVQWTKRKLLNIMAHEMIHYLCVKKGFFKENHGSRFIAEMNRVNNLGKGYVRFFLNCI